MKFSANKTLSQSCTKGTLRLKCCFRFVIISICGRVQSQLLNSKSRWKLFVIFEVLLYLKTNSKSDKRLTSVTVNFDKNQLWEFNTNFFWVYKRFACLYNNRRKIDDGNSRAERLLGYLIFIAFIDFCIYSNAAKETYAGDYLFIIYWTENQLNITDNIIKYLEIFYNISSTFWLICFYADHKNILYKLADICFIAVPKINFDINLVLFIVWFFGLLKFAFVAVL